ncbi:hypothetical protein HanIR_Chr10g0487071 [Helianthus annuus]|nr:hypothetical protein HanIR_Chr10g0487071 [Helianthus annuus]
MILTLQLLDDEYILLKLHRMPEQALSHHSWKLNIFRLTHSCFIERWKVNYPIKLLIIPLKPMRYKS